MLRSSPDRCPVERGQTPKMHTLHCQAFTSTREMPMLAGNKVIITVAINGGMQQDRDGAIIPKQPAEIGAGGRALL